MNSTTIITEKMLAGGDCLAKIDGKSVFVRGALPNETLNIKIASDKKDFYTAEITEILKPSPERIQPVCPFYGICGGCNMQIASVSYQRKLKTAVFKEALLRAGISEDEIPVIQFETGAEWEYRSRFQLHEGGLKVHGTNTVVHINDCPVAVPEIRQFLKENPQLSESRTHVFGANGTVITAEEQKVQKTNGRFAGSLINEKHVCIVSIKDKNINFDVLGFFQSNLQMLAKTTELITKNMGGKKCADIYSGVGTFSLFLADKFEELYLVEHNRDALVMAERNLAGIKHRSYGVSGAKWASLADARTQFDAVVIDPPRSGMERDVRNWLKTQHIPQIRALSCDPVTFARDAEDLLSGGYMLDSLCLLDYYPQTAHIETLANFVLR